MKSLAKDTENKLSIALHNNLTNSFVDYKLKIVVRELNLNKKIDVKINEKKDILLNEKIIGKIKGAEVLLHDRSSYIKNKLVYNKISTEVSKAVNGYIYDILMNKNFSITVNKNLDIIYDDNKIGSIYKGDKIFKPKVLISNNNFINENNYLSLKNKIENQLSIMIAKSYWKNDLLEKISNSNLKAIIFALDEKFGIVKIKDVLTYYLKLSRKELTILKKNRISISNNHIYYNKVIEEDFNNIRWIISNLFFSNNTKNKNPKKKIFLSNNFFNSLVLNSVGYVTLGKFVIKLTLLENFYNENLSEERDVYYFNYYQRNRFNTSFLAIYEILRYFNYKKIAGTNVVSYWKRKDNDYKKFVYDKNNPFYVLKKLQ